MTTNDVRARKHALTVTRGWIFFLMLMLAAALAFVGVRYRLYKNDDDKPPAFVQTKRHIYVQPSGDQPEIPIVYARSL